MEPPSRPPPRPPYRSLIKSGALTYTVHHEDVIHMWCNVDLECPLSPNHDWAVCSSVGFIFDQNTPEPLEKFWASMNLAMLNAGPGAFRVARGQGDDGIPCVECVAYNDYRWLVWTSVLEGDGLYEWTLWRAEDLQPGPSHPRAGFP